MLTLYQVSHDCDSLYTYIWLGVVLTLYQVFVIHMHTHTHRLWRIWGSWHSSVTFCTTISCHGRVDYHLYAPHGRTCLATNSIDNTQCHVVWLATQFPSCRCLLQSASSIHIIQYCYRYAMQGGWDYYYYTEKKKMGEKKSMSETDYWLNKRNRKKHVIIM